MGDGQSCRGLDDPGLPAEVRIERIGLRSDDAPQLMDPHVSDSIAKCAETGAALTRVSQPIDSITGDHKHALGRSVCHLQ